MSDDSYDSDSDEDNNVLSPNTTSVKDHDDTKSTEIIFHHERDGTNTPNISLYQRQPVSYKTSPHQAGGTKKQGDFQSSEPGNRLSFQGKSEMHGHNFYSSGINKSGTSQDYPDKVHYESHTRNLYSKLSNYNRAQNKPETQNKSLQFGFQTSPTFAQNSRNRLGMNERMPNKKTFVGYTKLLEWSNNQNCILLLFQMSMDVEGLEKMLSNNSIQFDWMQLLITALKKVLVAQAQKGSLHHVLKCICDSLFFDWHLECFLKELSKRKCHDTYSIIVKLLDVIEYLIDNMKKYLPKYNRALFLILECGEKLNVIEKTSDLHLKVEKLITLSRTEEARPVENPLPLSQSSVSRFKRKKFIPMADDDTPPDDYKTMEIFPETKELYSSIDPFLRANKTKGAYRDLQHYLDIHARLIKEDYLAPIRDGLKNYMEALAAGVKAKEHDLRFYYDVKLQMKQDEDQGITHWAIFDKTGLEKVEWEFSKRLMFGSLLVFSKDNFETTVFATVANRDSSRLEKGIIEVVFQNNLEVVFTASENDRFIMAETTAYFESHRHVLEGLQEMKQLPLDRYIISCKKEVHPPKYLKNIATYNLACVMQETYDDFSIPIWDESKWPDAYATTLNDSQLEALKLALTHEMAIIQGPPGTGKTYIGLKIMEILLENNVTKDPSESSGPILVVCYTNHALDQFLEGILEFCSEGIVRVGGRSSSKLLENYNLRELRSNPSLDRKIETNIKINIRNCRKELKMISKEVQNQWQQSLHLETTIVNLEDLDDEISQKHYAQLSDPSRSRTSQPPMRTWLKAANANMENHLFKAAKCHLSKTIASEINIEERYDMVLTCRLSASKLLFKERVKIYRFWLNKHKAKIAAATEEIIECGESMALDQLLHDGEEASHDILPDDILVKYMSSDNIYNVIKECVQMENKTCECENDFIKAWLLNNFTKADQLLDAIEQLTEKKKEQGTKQGINVDSEAKIHNSRWVIDESDSSPSEHETDFDDSDSEIETGMDDIDDVGISFKELARNFKQQGNQEIQMLQRAERLRIDLSEKPENNIEDEWQEVNNSSMSYSKVFSLFHKTVPFTEVEACNVEDVWKLTLHDRYKLYKFWVQSKKKKLSKTLISLTQEFKDILQRKKEANSLKDIAILQRARVIGMTTTGAAKHRKVLQSVGCRIIVVEEAAEVLEAHIVTTLNSNCQHLILIGDHQQLRPSPTVHKLAVDYNLEISLFERLVNNNVPHVTLSEQHRMRPEISQFVKHIYPRLEDHYSVTGFDDIRGVASNVFFLQHSFEESEVDDSASKSNLHEAKFVTALCKYFLQHDYLGKKITILAAYSGQVTCIRNEMEPEKDVYEGVRVTSIDNYQGEENTIVLLSLVRSNTENEVGFLKTDNRVCVALSRAKRGMFVIGNLPLLAKKSKLWTNILSMAQDEKITGVNMRLVCVNHANHVTYVSNSEDFKKEVPEGGCNRKCDYKLPCGHTCMRMCHASDRFHEETKCEQPCLKKCSKGHPCQRNCFEECGDCEVMVQKTMPLCGHVDNVPCSKNLEELECSQPCGQIMICGHICHGKCGKCFNDAEHQPCTEKVLKTWQACQHTANVECKTDVADDPCPEKCLQRLECGHLCKGTCGGCLSGRVHRPCSEKCKTPLPCGHPCHGPCGGQCVPCGARCVVCCRHGNCDKDKCGDLCEPCTENCAMSCQHRQCNLRCMDECRTPACGKPCGKITKCKHKCYSLCGEPCVCYPCEKDKFSLIDSSGKKKPHYAVAHDKRERAKKFEVQHDTVLMKIPRCGEIFTINQLDKYVESFEPLGTSFIKCPNCPVPVMGIARYENINKLRTEKRENKKAALIKASSVSADTINILLDSKELVSDFCNIDEGDFLTRKPGEIDANHAMALSLQIRFSLVLKKIYKIHQEFSENIKFAVIKWKLIINTINRNVTEQFFREMSLELHRLLLLEQLHILTQYLEDIGKLSDELKTTSRSILKGGRSRLKLTMEDKLAYQSTIEELYSCFEDLEADNHWHVQSNHLREQCKFVTRFLDQPMEKDLKSILREIKK
ncbi:NFX1-type zinc finger-containing protein 1 [Biomphalaria glabrata]|nr:NFX1-type zinc finger-containing protein 1-like [Biomphalaria glabrata]